MRIEDMSEKQKASLKMISELSDRELVILSMRYGKRKTQEEVASILGITKERVRQLEDRAIKTVNTYFP